MSSLVQQDTRYREIMLQPIRVCAEYKPKLGQGKGEGYTLEQFQNLYGGDPFYSWLGLDNPLMYAAHKAAGGMTSIYRQLGIGCEHLFRAILQDQLQLTAQQTTWSYSVESPGNKTRRLSLDGRISINDIKNNEKRAHVSEWIQRAAVHLGVDDAIVQALSGVVFEVRQGYKSKDSKRQNADLANAAAAYTQSYLPAVLVLSAQIDTDIVLRYRASKWLILIGSPGLSDPFKSTYDFMERVVGYNLAGFFERNSEILRREIDLVLQQLLEVR